MTNETEKNLQNNLNKFFNEVNKYKFDDIQSLFEYLSKRLEMDGFKCHQQFSFILNKTLIIFNKVEYINILTVSYSINVIISEETLKVLGVTKSETKTYNEIIF